MAFVTSVIPVLFYFFK